MGLAEGLVEVDVHDVEAEVAGLHLADDGVEVRAVAVHQGAVAVYHLGDLDDVAVEEAEGAGLGDHEGGDGGAVLFQRLA